MMRIHLTRTSALLGAVLLLGPLVAEAQTGSTRPRRVNSRSTTRTEKRTNADGSAAPLLDVEPVNTSTRPARRANSTPAANPDTPLLNPTPSAAGAGGSSANASSAVNAAPGAGSPAGTSRAFSLLQQKQYEAARAEARQAATLDPTDSDAWKIAGFAAMNLKQYEDAVNDLQKALDLQRAAKQEDPFTVDALAHAYILTEKFDRALPLLALATARKEPKADPAMLYYRGLAEYRTGKAADAERTFNAVVKENPKDAAALFFLGQLAYERKDLDGAIAALNRATLGDARSVSAWALLTTAYLQRAGAATVPARADADYLNAVRAAEGLTRLRTDAEANTLLGQALIGAKQFPRAASVLERATAGADASGVALYLLGVAQSRAKNFPRAISALERAAAKTPTDVNIYRELGYAYEISKQYAKALAAYEKGAELAPGDAYFTESVERVRPYAK
ncbi:MAG TPA: tetratricopeptide repeat protein [Pyrinomonadaceae bacterium]|jgi:tetratricopeptide (TPR) repeat protein